MVIQPSLGLEFKNWDWYSMDNNGLHRHQYQHRSKKQSFSSALLDAICKSTEDEGGMMVYKKSSNRQETRNVEAEYSTLTRNSSYKRVINIERQMEEDPWLHNGKPMSGRSSRIGVFNTEKYDTEATYSKHREFHLPFQPNISSAPSCSSDYTSDSNSNCPYLSSDAESLYRHTSAISAAKSEKNSYHVGRGDKACKLAVGRESSRDFHGKSSVRFAEMRSTEKPFIPAEHPAKVKSKSKTNKDSKKPKQPTSPGRKLANFLNSLFMAGGTKKPKLSSSSSVSESTSYYSSERKPASVSSSSSSVHSRPCLSKSSRGPKKSNGVRSVRFYPTSEIVDEDSRPCGEKCLHATEKHPSPNPNPSNYPHKHTSMDAYKLPILGKKWKYRGLEKDSHVAAAAAKDIIAKYQKADSILKAVVITNLDKEEDEEDDDDASCSSSDLFELENLAGTDMNNMYQKELPVYETTHLETNKAIAKGLVV